VGQRQLHRPRLEHRGARLGHLEHLLVPDRRQPAGVGDHPRVGGEHGRDVGEDLALAGVERRRDGDRRRVRAPSAQCRHVAVGRHPLEARDQHDRSVGQCFADAVRLDADQPGVAVAGVGADPGLRSRQRHRVGAELGHRHRRQRAGDRLTDRQQGVELPQRRPRRHRVRLVDELVGGLPHRRQNRHDPAAGALCGDHAFGHRAQAVVVCDGGPAELPHERCRRRGGCPPAPLDGHLKRVARAHPNFLPWSCRVPTPCGNTALLCRGGACWSGTSRSMVCSPDRRVPSPVRRSGAFSEHMRILP
jgi:hypothetical protein